jgi:hypothetical protein
MDRQMVPAGVPERRMTAWHNPTKRAQSVVINDTGNAFAFVVQPGETKELDSRYDRAINTRDCGREDCHRTGWFCTRGHDGNVVGGGAPLLRRVGHSDTLDPSLDPDAQARKSVEAEIDREVERERILAGARARRSAELEEANKLLAGDRPVRGKTGG